MEWQNTGWSCEETWMFSLKMTCNRISVEHSSTLYNIHYTIMFNTTLIKYDPTFIISLILLLIWIKKCNWLLVNLCCKCFFSSLIRMWTGLVWTDLGARPRERLLVRVTGMLLHAHCARASVSARQEATQINKQNRRSAFSKLCNCSRNNNTTF